MGTTLGEKPFENIVGKGENAGKQHFLLFPQWFLLYQGQNMQFELRFLTFVVYNALSCFKSKI